MYLQRFLRPISSYEDIDNITSIHYNISSNTAAKSFHDSRKNMNMAGKGKLSKKNTRKRVFTKAKRKRAPEVNEYEEELQNSNSVLQIPRELSDVFSLNLTPVDKAKEASMRAKNEEDLDEALTILLAKSSEERKNELDETEFNEDGRKSWFDRPRRFSDSYIVNLTSVRKHKPPQAYTDDELSERLRVMLAKKFPGKPIPDLRIRESSELKKIKQIYSNNMYEVSPGLVKLLSKMRLLNSASSSKSKEASGQANNEGDSSETPKGIPSRKSSRKKKEASQVGKARQYIQKRTPVEVPSTKISRNLRSAKLTVPTKIKEALPQSSNEGDLCETPKVMPSRKSSRKRKEASQVGNGKQDMQKRTSDELPSTSTKTVRNLRSGNLTAPSKRKESLPQANDEDLCETPNVNKRPRRKILEKVLQKGGPKTIQATVDPKLKKKNAAKLSTSNSGRLKRNSNNTLPSTVPAEHSMEQMHVTQSGGSTRAPPLTILEEDSDVSLDSTVMTVGEPSKRTARTKPMKRRINPKKWISNKDTLQEKIFSTATSSASTNDFIVSSESEESTSAPFLSIFESDSDESLDGIYMRSENNRSTAAPKSVKKKKKSKEREEYEAALEKEMREIPKYTSSLFEDSLDSNSSSYKFLEEIGMLDSDVSVSSVESRFPQKKKKLGKKKSPKKKVIEDSYDEKTLSQKLKEYDEYLKSISICDLSLKRWRV